MINKISQSESEIKEKMDIENDVSFQMIGGLNNLMFAQNSRNQIKKNESIISPKSSGKKNRHRSKKGKYEKRNKHSDMASNIIEM